jgi:solute carrier family 25 protein 16
MSTSTSLKPVGGHAGFEFFIRSALAGGFTGGIVSSIHELFHLLYRSLNMLINQAKTAVAPLDRIKILFQTHNAEFQRFSGLI